jgi:hypothetical protein
MSIFHPKAATEDEILNYAIERLAALPVKTALLIQYPRYSLEGVYSPWRSNQNEMPDAIVHRRPRQQGHHSPNGNEVIAAVIANALEVQ